MKIACPRLSIPELDPPEFAAELNKEPDKNERMQMAILACMVALGGQAKCTLTGEGLRMESITGILLLGVRDDGTIAIEERAAEVRT